MCIKQAQKGRGYEDSNFNIWCNCININYQFSYGGYNINRYIAGIC